MSDNIIRFPTASDSPPPKEFQLRQDGVYFCSPEGESQDRQRLCSPLRVVALGCSNAGASWGKLIEVTDPDGRCQRVFIPSRMFGGDGREAVAMLLDRGLRLQPGGASRNALLRLIILWEAKARFILSERLGWLSDDYTTFLVGLNRRIGTEHAMPTANISAVAQEIREKGTIDDWRDGVARPCLGNPLLIVSLCQAFTGPLLAPLDIEGGGLHFRGPSSRGKTTILRVAVSVWGAPGLMNSWRATDNGLEGIAAALNGTLCALDEIGEAPARVVSEMVYMLANGAGKARAAKSGEAIPHSRWRVPMLSTGEMSIADKVAENMTRAKAGLGVRLLDLPAEIYAHGAFDCLHDAPSAAAFAQVLKQAAATAYGVAGPAFVEALLSDRDVHLDTVRQAMTRFREDAQSRHSLGGEGQAERALTRFALIGAAGELATEFGLTGWPVGTAETAGHQMFDHWISSRGGREPAEKREAIIRVRAFITEHGPSRFQKLHGANSEQPVRDRAGYFGDGVYWFTEDSWKRIHAGSDTTQAARYLKEADYLLPGDGNRLKRRAPNEIPGRPRLYAIKGDIVAYE